MKRFTLKITLFVLSLLVCTTALWAQDKKTRLAAVRFKGNSNNVYNVFWGYADSARFFWKGKNGTEFNYLNLIGENTKYERVNSENISYPRNFWQEVYPIDSFTQYNPDSNQLVRAGRSTKGPNGIYNAIVIYEVPKDSSSLSQKYRNTKTFNASGQLVTYLEESWNDSAWQNTYKNNYTINEQNNITEVIVEEWNIERNSWINSFKDNFTYDTNQNLVEYLYSLGGTNGLWRIFFKETFTYNSEQRISSLLREERSDSNWIFHNQFLYSYPSNTNSDTQYVMSDLRKNKEGEVSPISSSLFQKMNDYEFILTYYPLLSNKTEFTIRTYTYFNRSFLCDSVIKESWENQTLQSKEKLHYSYNEEQKPTILSKEKRHSNDSVANHASYHLFYEDIEDKNSISNIPQNLSFTVYPIPASNKISIQTANEGIKTIELYDIAGRLIKQQTLPGNTTHTELWVNDIPSGNYIIKAIGNTAIGTKKIIVGH